MASDDWIECPQCRYRFTVRDDRDWTCPSCEFSGPFTDTGLVDLRAQPEIPADWLAPIHRNENHPVRRYFFSIGNGLWEDDRSARDLPAPHLVYRFQRADQTAYIWADGGTWQVRPWCSIHNSANQPPIRRAVSFEAALDILAAGQIDG